MEMKEVYFDSTLFPAVQFIANQQWRQALTEPMMTQVNEVYIRADSRFAPSQWETALLCNDVSHWLGANLKSALYIRHQTGARVANGVAPKGLIESG